MFHRRTCLRLGVAGLFALLLAACAAAGSQPTPAPAASLPLKDCQLSAPGLPSRLAAQCGSLKVYEDPAAKTGRQIDLNIAVIPAVSRRPAADPLFILAGGPGQAATETYVQLSTAFDRLNQKRAIVLVDQRGTGHSHPLTCPKDDTAQAADSSPAALTAWAADCAAQLDADPRLYTTAVFAQDLDQVRAALGYNQINLYGVSYGTRAALTYLRAYPDRVRSVILDGVVPQNTVLGQDVAVDAQHALDMIFARCAAEEACRTAFPNVRSEFNDLLGRLQKQPQKVSLRHPITGEPTEVTFTPGQFGAAVRLLSYAPESVALLPLLIHTSFANNDFSLLAAQYLTVAGQLSDSINVGLDYSVLCAEDYPFFDPAKIAAANANTYLGSEQSDALNAVCQAWPHNPAPASFKDPVQSNTPVLLISGQMDPVTPPANGDLAAKTLPNSLHVVAPGQGHNNIYRGCLPDLATQFVEQGSVQGLDAACVQKIQPLPFFVNFSGPKP